MSVTSAVGELALTRREREIWALTADGLSDVEIAAQLIVGYTTVKTHQQHLREKLGARNRVEVAVRFVRQHT